MYQRDCVSCETPFETESFRQTKCRKDCGRKRKSRTDERTRLRHEARAAHELTFIGVDGEGINTHKWVQDWDIYGDEIQVRISDHQYVLLSVGDQSLHKNGAELTHHDIFSFLYDQFLENPKAVFVGYFLGYDFTMWMKSLPARSAWELLTPGGQLKREYVLEDGSTRRRSVTDATEIRWVDRKKIEVGAAWEFDSIGLKQFKLRPYIPRERFPQCTVAHKTPTQIEECAAGRHNRNPNKWMFINDTGSFFQAAFLKAIDPKTWTEPVVTPEEFEVISSGKGHRSCKANLCYLGLPEECSARFNPKMIEYNILENDVLARLMTRINAGFVEDDIRLSASQWYGPGQAASAWMKLIGVPRGEEIREVVPLWAREAARDTYYGGWFEIFSHGPVLGTSYNYDINSAYPAIIAELPCLLHGKWQHGKSPKPRALKDREIRMLYLDVEGEDPVVGPLQYRRKDGSICRPSRSRGWHWQHEVEAAYRAGLISKMRIREWVTYTPCDCPPPLEKIRELYDGRLRVGKNSPQGKGKKLVYNSSYGKMAQSIGKPKFSNSIYASLITAGCRTMILDAIATHPTKTKSLLMIATDGIVFKEPHPNLDIDPERLGAWDAGEYQNLSLFMPGVYWNDEAREAVQAGKTPKLKSRGVAPKDLGKIIERIDKMWPNLYRGGTGPGDPLRVNWPTLTMSVDFALTSAKLAISRGAWSTCGRVSHDTTRKVSGCPDRKRLVADHRSMWFVGLDNHEVLGWRSQPIPEEDFRETTYYSHRFGDPELQDREPTRFDDEEVIPDVEDLVTQDGTFGDVWGDILGNQFVR